MGYTDAEAMRSAEIRAGTAGALLDVLAGEMADALGGGEDAQAKVRSLIEAAEWALVHRTDLQARRVFAGLGS